MPKVDYLCIKCGKLFERYSVACWACGGVGCAECQQTGIMFEIYLCPKCYQKYRLINSKSFLGNSVRKGVNKKVEGNEA